MAITRLGSNGHGTKRISTGALEGSSGFGGKAFTAAPLPPLFVGYVPGVVPYDSKYLHRYLQNEFVKISQAIAALAAGYIPETFHEPEKPRNGMVKLADGANWNPGGGAGVYVYFNGQWNKL